VMLSVARSNSKPKPAAPSGNLEKNLCNLISSVFSDRFSTAYSYRILVIFVKRITITQVFFITLSWYFRV
jgi:hypothetical protein